jgi:hypothetical protein
MIAATIAGPGISVDIRCLLHVLFSRPIDDGTTV